LRARVIEDAAFGERRKRLRAWQAGRLARTHRDLLESRRYGAAAQFFLTDLYGPSDLSRHIEDVRRLVPVMTSVLPDSGLATVAHAVELNSLSDNLDGPMVEALDKLTHMPFIGMTLVLMRTPARLAGLGAADVPTARLCGVRGDARRRLRVATRIERRRPSASATTTKARPRPDRSAKTVNR
jgi:hypothetical protein